MKGRFVVMFKKWWLTVLVFALILPLVSCAKKRASTLTAAYGFTQCDGSIGSFDVWVVRSQAQPGTYELYIVTVQANQPGDIASVTIANQSLAYKQLQSQIVLFDQQEMFVGYLTDVDLDSYDILAITPYDPSTNFAAQNPAKDAFCALPLPGDGAAIEDQYMYN